ncbi:MAG: dUTP diphosphatase [Thermoplasmata archaeon]|nr:MAG: dUTP diphosphatase [Thermoplasmata archaeon]
MRISISDDGCYPSRAHANDAGLDLRSTKEHFLHYKERALIDTGVAVEIPEGYFGLLVLRSSLGTKRGAILKNTVGVIDSSYRNNIFCSVENSEERPLIIRKYERFAQLILIPILTPEIEVVDTLADTIRGLGGFGSTGEH